MMTIDDDTLSRLYYALDEACLMTGAWSDMSYADLPEHVIEQLRKVAESLSSEADQRDAARWRWLVSRINYNDETRGTATNETAPPLTWRVRCWKHDSNDFVSDSITLAVDAAMSAQSDAKERKDG